MPIPRRTKPPEPERGFKEIRKTAEGSPPTKGAGCKATNRIFQGPAMPRGVGEFPNSAAPCSRKMPGFQKEVGRNHQLWDRRLFTTTPSRLAAFPRSGKKFAGADGRFALDRTTANRR